MKIVNSLKILMILLVFLLSSCLKGKEVPLTVNIEGCEYFENKTHGPNFVYTHKGNCKNPIHKEVNVMKIY